MSSSTDYNFIFILTSIERNLYRFGGPILMIFGTFSNILSLIVFTQKNLRKNPCSIYFIAFNIANLILIYASFVPPMLEIGYEINHTAYNLTLCRLRLYVAFVFNCLCPSYLILASIDRVLITSPNAHIRRRSTRRNAFISTISGALYWLLTTIHVAIFSTILELQSNYFYCYLQPGFYTTAVTYGSLIKETLTPLLMIIFGLWSVKNIHRMRHIVVVRVLPRQGHQIKGGTHTVRAKDRQLIIMLLSDITIYIPFSCIMTVSLMYQQFAQYKLKTLEEIQIERLISSVAMFSAHIPFCITSYAHLLVSKAFRQELKNVFLRQRLF